MATRKIQKTGEVLYGRDVINLLQDFYLSSEGDRIMIVPSLNFDTPELFKHCISASIDEYDDDLYDVSNLDLGNGSLRIITDTKNKCPECGAELEFSGGCNSCPSCGFSKCS